MEQVTYCVWCGCENDAGQELCAQCAKPLNPKESLLIDFLVVHTKDKIKGDMEDNLYEALKNFLLSHLYSVIITIALVVTAAAAVLSPDPTAHIEKVDVFPLHYQEPLATTVPETTVPETTVPATTSGEYVITEADKAEIGVCLEAFAQEMTMTGMIGDDYEYLNYLISDELETALGYDSYVDMFYDHTDRDLYPHAVIHSNKITFDEATWSSQPRTQNGQQLVDMGYTIATVYVDYAFYGTISNISNIYETKPTNELIGTPRYLMTFTIENGKWLLVEQINVSERYEDRKDALL